MTENEGKGWPVLGTNTSASKKRIVFLFFRCDFFHFFNVQKKNVTERRVDKHGEMVCVWRVGFHHWTEEIGKISVFVCSILLWCALFWTDELENIIDACFFQGSPSSCLKGVLIWYACQTEDKLPSLFKISRVSTEDRRDSFYLLIFVGLEV